MLIQVGEDPQDACGKQRAFSPAASRAPQGSEFPRIIAIPFPILFSTFSEIGRLLVLKSAFNVRFEIGNPRMWMMMIAFIITLGETM